MEAISRLIISRSMSMTSSTASITTTAVTRMASSRLMVGPAESMMLTKPAIVNRMRQMR